MIRGEMETDREELEGRKRIYMGEGDQIGKN